MKLSVFSAALVVTCWLAVRGLADEPSVAGPGASSDSAAARPDQPARRPAPRSPAERYFLSRGSVDPTWDKTDVRKLVGLQLHGPAASDQVIAQTRGLRDLRVLSAWSGSPDQLTDDALGSLAAVSTLEFLTLGPNRISDRGLARLKTSTGLRGLILEPARVTNTGLAELRDLCCLQSLSLNGSDIDDEGLAHLARMSHLEFLSLRASRVTEGAFEQLLPRVDERLQEFSGPHRLKVLMLPYELQLSDSAVASLVQLMGMSQLERVAPLCPRSGDLHDALDQYRLVIDSWKKRHAYVEFAPGAEGLEITGLYFQRDGGATLNADVEGLPTTLKRLSLRGAEVTDDVLLELAELDQLETLNLFATGVPPRPGTAGSPGQPAQHCAPGTRTVPGRPYIPAQPPVAGQAPTAWRPGITDRGLEILARQQLPNLKTVILDDDETRISAAAVQQFEAATGAQVIRLPLEQPPACCPQLEPRDDSEQPQQGPRSLVARRP
ncbi:MAG: hypothetical protein J5I93_18870 [Pirellulaceae bacterium]|nr:hypothetical protein [Pirellulaceae bacterium]